MVPARKSSMKNGNDKSLESWIWDAACSIRGAKDAPTSSPRAIRRTTFRMKPSFASPIRSSHGARKRSTREEITKNEFNISPSRYIHTGAGEEYRPLAEIVEELDALEAESRETDAELKKILARLGV
jgi:type I restriction-modification system DNA methylase subunit